MTTESIPSYGKFKHRPLVIFVSMLVLSKVMDELFDALSTSLIVVQEHQFAFVSVKYLILITFLLLIENPFAMIDRENQRLNISKNKKKTITAISVMAVFLIVRNVPLILFNVKMEGSFERTVSLLLLGAVFEEVLFKGYLYVYLIRRNARYFLVVCFSFVLFFLMHMNFTVSFFTFSMAWIVVSYWSFHYWRSLTSQIVFHFLTNVVFGYYVPVM